MEVICAILEEKYHVEAEIKEPKNSKLFIWHMA